jgi:DNA-binding IclR family transcriptional regulator
LSRKLQILQAVSSGPLTTREIADALGIKMSTTRVHVACAHSLGIIRPVGSRPSCYQGAKRKSSYLWGPA